MLRRHYPVASRFNLKRAAGKPGDPFDYSRPDRYRIPAGSYRLHLMPMQGLALIPITMTPLFRSDASMVLSSNT